MGGISRFEQGRLRRLARRFPIRFRPGSALLVLCLGLAACRAQRTYNDVTVVAPWGGTVYESESGGVICEYDLWQLQLRGAALTLNGDPYGLVSGGDRVRLTVNGKVFVNERRRERRGH